MAVLNRAKVFYFVKLLFFISRGERGSASVMLFSNVSPILCLHGHVLMTIKKQSRCLSGSMLVTHKRRYINFRLKTKHYFNPIQDGHFRGCSRIERPKGSPLSKICHRYPKMTKLGTVIPYLKKIQKIYESRDTSIEFCLHQQFFTGNQQIYISYIKKYRHRLHFDTCFLIFLTVLESLKHFFNKPGYNFDDVSKNGYPRPS